MGTMPSAPMAGAGGGTKPGVSAMLGPDYKGGIIMPTIPGVQNDQGNPNATDAVQQRQSAFVNQLLSKLLGPRSDPNKQPL